jgi:hypothetical protein
VVGRQRSNVVSWKPRLESVSMRQGSEVSNEEEKYEKKRRIAKSDSFKSGDFCNI